MAWQGHRELQREFLDNKREVCLALQARVRNMDLCQAQSREWSGQARRRFDSRLAELRGTADDAAAALGRMAQEAQSALDTVNWLIVSEG